MLARMIGLVAVVLVCTATSCTKYTGIAVAPGMSIDPDSAAQRALVVAENVVARRGLKPWTPSDQEKRLWIRCFEEDHARSKLYVCGKMKGREVHLQFSQTMARYFSPRADSVRAELIASLRAEFGEQAVRECTWKNVADARESGCPVPAAPEVETRRSQ